jgi:trans-aconitate methyltransferase
MIWKGEYYSKNSQPQEMWGLLLQRDIQLKEDATILDIGCGDGRLTAALCKKAPKGKVLGIDASEDCILWAKKKHRDPRLEFKVQDALDLKYEGVFDFIISTSCLHWVPDHQRVLQLISRALKPRGRFTLLFSSIDNPFSSLKLAIAAVINSPRWKMYCKQMPEQPFSFTTEEYLRWAAEAKLKSFSLKKVFSNESFQSVSHFVTWIQGWITALKQVPESLRRHCIEDIVGTYLDHYPSLDKHGRIHFAQNLWLIKGSMKYEGGFLERYPEAFF